VGGPEGGGAEREGRSYFSTNSVNSPLQNKEEGKKANNEKANWKRQKEAQSYRPCWGRIKVKFNN
jgi:hypothetical protein